MTETALSKEIRYALKRSGFWVLRLQSGKRGDAVHLCEPGVPDLLVIGPVYGFLEVKTATGKLSPSQQAWHEKAARKGIPVRVVRSVGEALEATKGMVRYE